MISYGLSRDRGRSSELHGRPQSEERWSPGHIAAANNEPDGGATAICPHACGVVVPNDNFRMPDHTGAIQQTNGSAVTYAQTWQPARWTLWGQSGGVLGLYTELYFDLNMRHFHEKLREEHGS
jgi:hypothetical protein